MHKLWRAKAKRADEEERERQEAEEKIAVQKVVEERKAQARQEEVDERQRKYDGLMAGRRKGKRMMAMQKSDEQG